MDDTVGGLTGIDWGIIALYAGGTLALGYHYGRARTTLQQYFTGSGRMNPTLIGVSMFATSLSTASYLAVPGEAIGSGPIGILNFLAYPVVFVIVGYVFLPLFMRRRVTSAYEFLEFRLGLGIRLLGATLFLSLRLIWMALIVYLSANAMIVILDVDKSWIPLVAACTGLVAVVYTSLGGFQAVVITDTVQSLLMLGGAGFVIAMVTYNQGGLGWFPTVWQTHWDTQPLVSFDPAVRVSLMGSFIYVVVQLVSTACSDQTFIQRFMATADLKAARRSFLVNQIVATILVTALWVVGFGLLDFFQSEPNLLPPGIDTNQNADGVFPFFIAFMLPPGISGLVVAAMFAAAMSSIDSGVNSITAVISRDFLDRFGKLPADESGRTRLAKALTLGIGTLVVLGSCLLDQVPGNFWAVSQKTTALLYTPLFALFFFALLVPFATSLGVVCGTISGITTAVLVAYSGPIFGKTAEGADPVSFMWIGPTALAVNLVVGSLVSYLHHRYRTPLNKTTD